MILSLYQYNYPKRGTDLISQISVILEISMYLTGILRLPHEFLFTMKICFKSLIMSSIYAYGVVTFDVVPTPKYSPPWLQHKPPYAGVCSISKKCTILDLAHSAIYRAGILPHLRFSSLKSMLTPFRLRNTVSIFIIFEIKIQTCRLTKKIQFLIIF